MSITAIDAVRALGYRDQTKYVMATGEIEWKDGHETTEEETNAINAKITELQNAEPMRLLRLERNKKLAKTDWMSFSDSPTMSTEWQTYRQSLRDLPSTASPSLNENGQLTNVTWPTKPE